MCEYCKDLPADKDKENMTFIESLASKEFVLCGSYNDGYIQLKIKYCPVCGRDLNEPKYEGEDDYIYDDECDYDVYALWRGAQ